jgi:hypothetical protein
MAPRVQEVGRLNVGQAARAGMTVAVILDSDEAARVAAIAPRCSPFVGMRFEHEGTVWELTHAKDYLRGWVARPAPRRRSPGQSGLHGDRTR